VPEKCPTYLPTGTFGVFVVHELPAATRLLFTELPRRGLLGNSKGVYESIKRARTQKPLAH
jgi:hypothetical protein